MFRITQILTLIPLLVGVLFLIIMNRMSGILFKYWPSGKINNFTIGLAFLIWSLSFLIIVLRKEAPFIVAIRGKAAVLYGSLFLLIGLFFGVSLVIKALLYY